MTNNQIKRPLYDALIAYAKSEPTVFDVPGHKMGRGIPRRFKEDVGEMIFKMDVNSMKELDSLSNPTGVIKEAEALAAELFSADYAYFLVNGSTSGVQQMILSAVNPGEKIIMPRNAHKSAFNALIISGAHPVYIQPYIEEETGIAMGVHLEEVKRTIDAHKDAKAIFLLHPTYFGYTQNLEEIIAYAHEADLHVLVDESHGSHFAFDDRLPTSSMTLGADLATISMHKTGGSLTQSSMLLHKQGRIPFDKVRSTINVFQTSSASYLLLASLDAARHQLGTEGKKRLKAIVDLSLQAQKEIDAIEGFKVLNHTLCNQDSMHSHDATKLVIDVSAFGLTGFQVYDMFKAHYNIQLELGETNVVLAIVSMGDTQETIQKLINGFKRFAREYPVKGKINTQAVNLEIPALKSTPRDAFFSPTELVKLSDAVGKTAGDSIMVYPPGIPLVVPGELITEETVKAYQFLTREDNIVIGTIKAYNDIYVRVLKEKKEADHA